MNTHGRASTRGLRVGAYILSMLMGIVFLAACSGPSNGATSQATTAATSAATSGSGAAATTATTVATSTPQPTATSASTPTPAVTATSASGTSTATSPATATSPVTATPASGTSAATYLDDRSTAAEVISSYYSAINSKEYARAYSYWESGTSSADLPPFDQFQQGYATTTSVQVTLGTVGGGVGAGQIYYSVPVLLKSTTTDKGDETFVGCYTLHLGNPANQTVPPFHPLAIQKADVAQVTGSENAQNMLAAACKDQGSNEPLILGTPSSDPNNISAAVYLDNRTSGVDEIRSYYNAINRKEYARAYSYWESNVDPSQLPAFPAFQQGYANTASVNLTLGNPVGDAGAGQLYTSVPATIVAKMTDGSTQTFVGCYTTHLAQPAIQTAPPFQPLAIQKARVKQVDNGADTASLMAQACQP